MNRAAVFIAVLFAGCAQKSFDNALAAVMEPPVWQWSVPVDPVVSPETNDHPTAYLWIPENCEQVRGVVLAQNNMIEEGMLEHPAFRENMKRLGLAEVWVDPMFTINFDFHSNIPQVFQSMMQKLADKSGYAELASVPVVPIGHSAAATFPWNFAAWAPERTLALVSVHGDAPQTTLTGYGRPNIDWQGRNIDGVPALFVMGEYEWWEDRIAPGFAYQQKHPKSVITWFADAGHGHFDYSDELVNYVALFIRKAVEKRLPEMESVDPETGWLMDRWRMDSLPAAKAAPYAQFEGDRYTASWIFDEEMAKASEDFYAKERGKRNQHIGFRQNGEVILPAESHAGYHLPFRTLEDGVSFVVSAFFADSTRIVPVSEHASTPLVIDRITGPVTKINDSTFRISFGRLGFGNPKRSPDIWLLAHNEGDEVYKSAVQQLNMRFPLFNEDGRPQLIEFPQIPDQEKDVKSLALEAASSAGAPVNYYVREGPAYVQGDSLVFTPVPPRAKFPVTVTVVAWQYGKAGELQSAKPVERSFYIKSEQKKSK